MKLLMLDRKQKKLLKDLKLSDVTPYINNND